MNSIVMNDERLMCDNCGSTESRVAPRKLENYTITGCVCTGCGTYSELSLDDFDLFENELTQSNL